MANTPVVVLDDTLTDIADAIRSKTGDSATMTPGQMPAQIASIPSGGGVGIPREVDANGVYGFPTQSFAFSLPANATNVGPHSFSYAFYGCTSLTSVDFSSLTTASGASAFAYAFYDCTSITSADFGSLTTVTENSVFSNAFFGCTALASVNFSSLTSVSGGSVFNTTFRGCTSLTSVNFSSLTSLNVNSVFYRAFYGCTSLASISFPALTASSFGSSTGQFDDMLKNVTGCTVHFPASTQAKIETMSGYPNFGGTNTTVLFDL